MPTSRWLAAVLSGVCVLCLAVAPAPAVAAGRHPIQVGALTLAPCQTSTLAWCTTVQVPFDYTDPAAGTTALYVEWFPATGSGAVGTVLTVQGGPGYSSTDFRDDYLSMLGPLTSTRNVLIVDLRGTGRSDPVRCPAVQNWTPADGNQAYIDAVGACGTRLNTTRRRPDGSFVRGSELYTTANAARDVNWLLQRLQTGPVDLYGDSYGTYFGQVFTSRFPNRLRSVTLDAAYPVLGADPFYPDAIATARTAFDLTCRRSVACRAEAPGSSWARIGAMAARLRTAPFTGTVEDPGGSTVTVTVDVAALVQLVNIAGPDSGVYRELDPAIRAYLNRGDRVPIMRLVAQSISTGDSGAAAEFSAGLYVATTCSDYPQPFSYARTYPQRLAQYQAALAALPADMFAPFTVTEWVTHPAEEFDACLRWPAPVVDDPPIAAATDTSSLAAAGLASSLLALAPLAPATLPVLVLSGELDSLTTPAEGRRVRQQMGPSARWIQIGNMIHVAAMLDFVGCAERLVRSFIRRPDQLAELDASCATQMPEVRVLGSYPVQLSHATPAKPGPGNQAGPDARRLAAIGAAAVGDAVWHWWYIPGFRGVGLRGGTFRFTGSGPAYGLEFRRLQWTDDVRVDGTGTWNQETGRITAALSITGPGGQTVTVDLEYADYEPGAVATLTGSAGAATLVATLPAP